MRKQLLSILFLVACVGSISAQKTGDMYANRFNEHLNKGLHSGITMSVELPLYAYGEENLVLQDTTQEGGIAGYVYNGYMILDSMEVDSAYQTLEEGIRVCPNRLDLYLGLATGYLYTLDIEHMLNVLELAMQQEAKNKHKWLWTEDEKLSKKYDILYTRIQEDFKRFMDAEEIEYAERLVRKAMQYFPTRAEYVNDLGTIYVYREDIDNALDCFHQALKLAPKDKLIKGNIQYLEQLKKEQ